MTYPHHWKHASQTHRFNQDTWPCLQGYPVHVRSSWPKHIFFGQNFYGQPSSACRETSQTTYEEIIFRNFLLECTNDPASSKIHHYFTNNSFQRPAIEIFPRAKPPNFSSSIEWRKNELSIYQNGDRSMSILKKTASSKRTIAVPW
jgi:hypothetical protein